jgi:hypothetical protein
MALSSWDEQERVQTRALSPTFFTSSITHAGDVRPPVSLLYF